MKYLNSIDYSVIGVYFAILMVMGIYFQRIASRSMEDYFLGGKKLPWWMLGVSGMGMFIDMTGTMIIVSFLYMLGPRGLYIEFRGGACLVLVFMLLWTGKWHRRSNCMTGAEWLIYRFGSGTGAKFARVIGAFCTIAANIAMLVYLIKGAGLFLSMFMPFSPITCAAIMVAVTVLYTMLSGFYGVVYTDLFQCFIILAAVIVIAVMAAMEVGNLGGASGLAGLAQEVTHTSQWMGSVPQWHTPMPEGYKQYSALMMFAMFYLVTNIRNGLGSGADSRYFGARNERECGLLSFFWTWLMMFRWPMMISFAVLGLILVKQKFPDQQVLRDSARLIKQHFVEQAYPGQADAINNEQIVKEVIPKNIWEDRIADIAYSQAKYPKLIGQIQQTLGPDWQRKVHMVSYEGTVNPERILPAVLLYRIPMGLRGLFVVALLAAAMSTFSPTVNQSVAFFTRDIYQAFLRRAAKNWELMGASYAFGVFMTLLSFAMAYWTKSINDIWGWIIMGLGSGIALPGVLRLYWWRFNATGVVVSLCVGLPAAIIQRILFPDLDERLQFLTMMSIALVGAIVGTYLGKPTDRQVLEHFYKTTRPFGLWGPLRNTLPPDVRETTRREHFYDLAALPFTFLWQVTLFLLPMQLVIRNMRDFWITLPIFLVSLFGMYQLWYKHLPPAQEVPGTAFGEVQGGVAGAAAD